MPSTKEENQKRRSHTFNEEIELAVNQPPKPRRDRGERLGCVQRFEARERLVLNPLPQRRDGNGAARWGADDRVELYNPFPPSDPVQASEVAMLAYRNKSAAYIQQDIEDSMGVKLVPLEVPEP